MATYVPVKDRPNPARFQQFASYPSDAEMIKAARELELVYMPKMRASDLVLWESDAPYAFWLGAG